MGLYIGIMEKWKLRFRVQGLYKVLSQGTGRYPQFQFCFPFHSPLLDYNCFKSTNIKDFNYSTSL